MNAIKVNRMNLKIMTSALLLAGMAASSAFASTGEIQFTGSISNVTCSVSGGTPGTDDPNFTVDIGPVSAKDLDNVGDVAGVIGFRIYIGKTGEAACANGTKVWATFENGSTVDPATGALVVTPGAGSATGVQIRLFDKLNAPIDILGNNQNEGVKETVADNQAILVYAAGYEAVGAVAAGAANSSVIYTVRYES